MQAIAGALHGLDPSRLVSSSSSPSNNAPPLPPAVEDWSEHAAAAATPNGNRNSRSGRKIVIVLLRNDLRVHDNASLYAAQHHEAKPTHILPVYVFDERHVECSGLPDYRRRGPEARTRLCGFWRTGVFRARLITEAVYDLRDRLRESGSDLLIRFGIPEVAIENLIRALFDRGDEIVGFELQKEVCAEEVAVERRISKALKKFGLKDFRLHDTKHMISKDDLPFKVEDTPDVFTPFRKKVEGLGEKMVRPMLEMPDKFLPFPGVIKTRAAVGGKQGAEQQQDKQDNVTEEGDEDDIRDEGNYGRQFNGENVESVLAHLLEPLKGSYEMKYADPKHSKHRSSAFPFPGGETAALERLEWYFVTGNPPPVSRYKETRNMLVGHAYSTKMSPYLCIGCISPRLIAKALDQHEKRYGSGQNTYWVKFEMLWRDYFLYVSEKFGTNLFKLEGFEAITDPKMAEKKKTEWNWWDEDNYLLKAWLRGRTGIPFIDANIVELRETGFMSNRGRQNVASFLTKDLYFDWRIGAEFFESHLVDYDPTANWGNWQYVAGVGNDPRASRQFNPIKQAHDYDPAGHYVRTWITQLKDVPNSRVHTPWLMADKEWQKYIKAAVDGSNSPNGGPELKSTMDNRVVKAAGPTDDRLLRRLGEMSTSSPSPSTRPNEKGPGSVSASSQEGSVEGRSGDSGGSFSRSTGGDGSSSGSVVGFSSANGGSSSGVDSQSSAPPSEEDDTSPDLQSRRAFFVGANDNSHISIDEASNGGSSGKSRTTSSASSELVAASTRASAGSRLSASSSSPTAASAAGSGEARSRTASGRRSPEGGGGGGGGRGSRIAENARRDQEYKNRRDGREAQQNDIRSNPERYASDGPNATQLSKALSSANDYSSSTPYPRRPLFEHQSWKPHYFRKDGGRRKGGAGGGNSRRLIRAPPASASVP